MDMDRLKMRRRIKKALDTGKERARVYFTNGTSGFYRIHGVSRQPFVVDRLGRVYFK